MSRRLDQLAREWDLRQERLGATPRAVLCKRFPGWLNAWIHSRHLRFVLRNIPPAARSLLDAGCGYGRISRGVRDRFPALSFQGVDLCRGFAEAYRRTLGPCFHGPVQDFQPAGTYDVILVITLLMYLEPGEHAPTLERLWSWLRPGGRLITIEPAAEFLALWRRLTGRPFAAPTGGRVHHFPRGRLDELLGRLDGAAVVDTMSLPVLPPLPFAYLHHGVAAARGEVASPPPGAGPGGPEGAP